MLERCAVLFLCFHTSFGFLSIFKDCEWKPISIALKCRGEPYVGRLEVEMLDRDTVSDDMMATYAGILEPRSGGVVELRGKVNNEDCSTVQPFVVVKSDCEKDLAFRNYGLTIAVEQIRRWTNPHSMFEVCLNIDHKSRFEVDLAEMPYCGLSEL